MKQWPLVASFVLFIALCASIAYWAMQVFTPPVRPATAPPPAARPAPSLDAAAGLFGGRSNVAVASNFQLKGVVVSGNPVDSVAILATDGKPPQAIRANAEVMPGVTVKEVHRQYVLLSDGGVIKRVELPEEAKSDSNVTMSSRAPAPVVRTAPAAPPRVVVNASPQAQPNTGVPNTLQPAAPPPQQQAQNPAGQVAAPANAGVTPNMDMGGPSIGYNPAGAQADSSPQRPSAPAPVQGAVPGQPAPATQFSPQTQPVPSTSVAPAQQR